MDKILVKMLGTTFGRSFIAGVFIAMAAAIGGLWRYTHLQGEKIQALNDRLVQAEHLYRMESEARWRADIERSQGLLNRLEQATKSMKKRR